jgi:nucleotidyltransferase substrate binding protein (TIGR01987 family)
MNIQDIVYPLTKLPYIDEIWLFGSRARGDHHERSDIDLAILCPRATREEWDHILEIIENAPTLLHIDCVRFDEILDGKTIKENIKLHKKVLYKEGHLDKIFWKDYFETLGEALSRLDEVLNHEDLDKIEYMRDAAIQRFEFGIELYWKVLKKILNYEKVDATTPRDVIKKAYQFKLINDERAWLNMLDDRNQTSHVYNKNDACQIFERIKAYYPVMHETYKKLKNTYFGENSN